MKKLALAIIPLALILALALIGCGKQVGGSSSPSTSTAPGTVGMDATNFTTTTMTIKAGDAIHFDDTVNGGGTHFLCLGVDQQCDKTAQGPQQLMTGFTINPGSKMDVTFPAAGTYKITCTLHQHMNVVVTVQ